MKNVCAVLVILLVSISNSWAQEPLTPPVVDKGSLVPEKKRITDEAIAADLKTMKTVQQRLTELNNKGVPIDSYHYAKAQAWLDFAMDEYSVNNRTNIIEEALGQSIWVTEQLEQGAKNITLDTPILPHSMKIRQDLWDKVAYWKGLAEFHCGEANTARLEVQLVWAGHEEKELGWRHSKPYLQAAERLAREIELSIATCEKPLVCPPCKECVEVVKIVEVPAPAPVPAPPAPPVQNDVRALLMKIPDSIHFGLDSAEISQKSTDVLAVIAKVMNGDKTITLELRGHTDVRGKKEYNENLSKRRGEAAKRILVAAGVEPGRISVTAHASSQLLGLFSGAKGHAFNRRVEFVFSGIKDVEFMKQDEDVQVEDKADAYKSKKQKAR